MTHPGNDQQAWLETLARLRQEGVPCVVVTVTAVKGSAPREAGARMIVASEGLAWGTIGGGNLEHLGIEHARRLLAGGARVSESAEYPLSEKVGQCCGGAVTLFYEVFPWRRRRVTIFGAGHVAQALGGLAGYMRADVLLIDPRDEDELQPPLPVERPYEVLFVDAPEAEVDELPADSAVLIMTHDHALDQEILAACLQRGGFSYVGLIGSLRKWQRFERRLAQRGFSPEQLGKVHCPIGGVRTSKEPTAIALAAASELVGVLDQASADLA